MRTSHLFAILFFLLLSLIGLFYTLINSKIDHGKSKPFVVCTTTIIADAVANIAENTIDLKILMGPGVDPHTYKPVEQDVITIANADIIFYNGLHLEARMAELFKHINTIQTTIAVTQEIPKDKLIYSNEFNEYTDPHVWFDPLLWMHAVETITKTLQNKIPTHAQTYEKNKKIYLEEIKKTYHQTLKKMNSIPQNKRLLMTGHDAFSYFGRAYHCKVVSLQGISTASEAGTQDVQNLIKIIVKHKIPTIFTESCIPTRNMQALQQGALAQGFQVHIGPELFSDALGAANTPEGTYLGMLKFNIESIATGLNRPT